MKLVYPEKIQYGIGLQEYSRDPTAGKLYDLIKGRS